MGRHADAVRSRGLAPWLIGTAIAVVVLLAITIGWFIVVRHADSVDSGLCTKDVTITVAAGKGASAAVADAASAYNATKSVVRSACVTASVTTVADSVALKGLADSWPSSAGAVPGLWIPDNAASLAALDSLRPDAAAGHPSDPFAWSPVVLAMAESDASAVTDMAWSDLQTAAGPSGTAVLPDQRHLTLALPPLATNRATSYALQSTLAADGQSSPVTPGAVTAHTAILDDIGAGAVHSEETTEQALQALASGGAVTSTGVSGSGATSPSSSGGAAATGASAVPAVEADLAAFNARTGSHLTAVYPSGATVGDSLIAAPITDPTWVDRTLAAAASSFQAYLSSPAGQQIMADHGWRTVPPTAPDHASPGIDVTATVTSLAAAGPDVDTALAAALGQPAPITPTAPPSSTPNTSTPNTSATQPSTAPPPGTSTPPSSSTPSTPTTTPSTTTPAPDPAASGPVLTLLVDSSEPTGATVGNAPLLETVTAQLATLTDGTITDHMGLWAFSDSGFLPPDGYPELVSTGPLEGKVDDTTRAQAITAALKGLSADGDRWAYGALLEALKKVPDQAVPDRQSRVILITSGVDETPGLPRTDVVKAVSALKEKVRVDVIGVASSVPVAAYTEIAKASGGEYIPVTDPTTLAQTIEDLLTLQD